MGLFTDILARVTVGTARAVIEQNRNERELKTKLSELDSEDIIWVKDGIVSRFQIHPEVYVAGLKVGDMVKYKSLETKRYRSRR